MSNKEISKLLKLTASLLELHDENQFKIRTFTNAVIKVEKQDDPLILKTQEELETIEGIGKGLAQSIVEIAEKGSFGTLDDLMAKTPKGIIEMIRLKGLGPKKIKIVWKELNIENIDQLYEACKQGQLEKLKGFGAKTQQTIMENLEYLMSQRGKALYAEAEPYAEKLLQSLKKSMNSSKIEWTGDMRRKMDVIDCVELLVDKNEKEQTLETIRGDDSLVIDQKASGPFSLKGSFKSLDLKWHVRFSDARKFHSNLMLSTGSGKHLSLFTKDEKPLYLHLLDNEIGSEKEAYEHFGFSYIEPEMREGSFEPSYTKENTPPYLLTLQDLKGPFHNHSNYSDGMNTIAQLASYCIEQGYEYLGLSDHSKSAFYANGLQEFQIVNQHEEIDKLNEELAPFKIFKGIESDILNDGSLDYEDDVLASFDFIVASVHSNLNMDIQKATQRLIKAIENPYTTFLGHPTGRLLLRRKGYPIDHSKIIDACAANNVIIEINANPWRLDIDWRWVHYALDKGVILSINPDAHEIEGFADMKYGVFTGRKGGLTKEQTFNAWSLEKVESYLAERKRKILS
jgi:DNA polymerase (family 10)